MLTTLDSLKQSEREINMEDMKKRFSNCTNDEIAKSSEITHVHSISKEACRIYVEIVKSLIINKNLKDILENLECTKNFQD